LENILRIVDKDDLMLSNTMEHGIFAIRTFIIVRPLGFA